MATNEFNAGNQPPPKTRGDRSRWRWLITSGCVLVLLLAVFSSRQYRRNSSDLSTDAGTSRSLTNPFSTEQSRRLWRASSSISGPAQTAEQIVAGKLLQFAKKRRELVHAIAKRFKVEVPDDVERFFDAVERGDWDEINAAHNGLLEPGAGLNQPRSSELHQIWRGIQETWGIAREAHDWPPQKLLDYGNAILSSLRPGMIYVGGTDPGCFIPTFLNETSESEHHITLTQNALADSTYLDYLNFLHGDRLNTLTEDESKRAFAEYTSDAQKRLEHDQQFPDEPKQIRPGEDVRMVDGKVQVSGQIAVMTINEKLFQTLMQKNPDASFAMEESFPFKSVFSEATPLGPVMELRVRDEQSTLTRERATQSADYWRATAQQLLSDPESAESHNVRMAYSKLASSQAGLLLERGYAAEAERAFRAATDIAPASPEAVFRYVNLLVQQKRYEDATPIVENAIRNATENKQFPTLLQELNRLKKN